MLHDDKELFEQLLLRSSEYLGIKAEIIEKDYYVTLFLKELVAVAPEIIFKGGTSLSKCFHLIDRFSEDIDLNIESETKPSESKRKKLKHDIESIIEKLNFTLTNPDDVKSRKEYNRYIIDFSSVLGVSYLKNMLIVETAIYQRAYPTVKMKATSLIYDYLSANNFLDFINKYELEPFELNVQTVERTLLDKIYALADYYLAGTIVEHSRHIYDIYKLLSVVTIDDELKKLAVLVADERRPHSRSLSVQEGIDINRVLHEIIDKRVYESDYNEITNALLFEPVDYETAIQALSTIVDSGLFTAYEN
jgi:predicted nucleotidyltransferase component of viral defense system